jgi:hypothetical protein
LGGEKEQYFDLVGSVNNTLAPANATKALILLDSSVLLGFKIPTAPLLVLGVTGCLEVMPNVGEKFRKLGAPAATLPIVRDASDLLTTVLCLCSGFTRPAGAITADIDWRFASTQCYVQ